MEAVLDAYLKNEQAAIRKAEAQQKLEEKAKATELVDYGSE